MADDESEFEILSEGGPPDEHDLEILETLEEHGADLAEPREIRVNLSFPSEQEAEAAGSELEEAGYDVVGFEATGEEEPWAIRASRDLARRPRQRHRLPQPLPRPRRAPRRRVRRLGGRRGLDHVQQQQQDERERG